MVCAAAGKHRKNKNDKTLRNFCTNLLELQPLLLILQVTRRAEGGQLIHRATTIGTMAALNDLNNCTGVQIGVSLKARMRTVPVLLYMLSGLNGLE
jgi:hypothetical protein